MSLSEYALISLEECKNYLQERENVQTSGISIYNSNSDGVTTAATVQVKDEAMILSVTSSGANNGDKTIDLTADDYDTLTELVDYINDTWDKGWVVNLEGRSNVSSTDLIIKEATSCLGETNKLILYCYDNFLLEMLINNASIGIENECRRKLKSRSFINERHSVTDSGLIMLNNYPIVSDVKVSTGRTGVMTIKNTLTDTAFCPIEVTTAKINLKIFGGDSNGSDEDLTFEDDDTITEMVDAINALDSDLGWTAELMDNDYADYPCSYLFKVSGLNAKETTITLYLPSNPLSDFDVLYDEGILDLSTSAILNVTNRVMNITVSYTGGYETIPEPLKQICCEMVAYKYGLSRLDRAFKKENISDGDYEYSAADFKNGLPPELYQQLGWYAKTEPTEMII